MSSYSSPPFLFSSLGLCSFQWVRSLHPDIFLFIEFNLDASGPFLATRTSECFDFHSTFMHCHDLLSSQQLLSDARVIEQIPLPNTRSEPQVTTSAHRGSGTHLHSQRSARFTGQAPQSHIDDLTQEQQEQQQQQQDSSSHQQHEQGHQQDQQNQEQQQRQQQQHSHSLPSSQAEPSTLKPSTGAFRIGLPESQLKAALKQLGPAIPYSPKPLRRPAFILFERFVFARSQINILALEGPQRFVRYWSHARWMRCMRKTGLVTSPVLPLVAKQVKLMLHNLPPCIGVSVSKEGLTMTVCGRDVIHMSLWTVDKQGGSSGLNCT